MAALKLPQKIGQNALSSNEIRSRFINFFKTKEHTLVKSSSVRPFADPTLEFVNAGMNQFKNVFLGLVNAPVTRAVNSQKCIRIGGKHNDLDVVGHDSYHHTFFEMLGNWSFGDYFKKEACSYALELMTSEPYSLPLERLYFTYFHGDKSLNLPSDIETKEIWLQLGVNEDRILGFGLKENFWEMGLTGPCGPCTEIHYDHLGSDLRPHMVNADLPDLTELWNIVFIQFNRQGDGQLKELAQSYVDTGMGLERLAALLQGKLSNYDSDLFAPLFDAIAENALVPKYRGRFGKYDLDNLDTKYRILADHSRMIAVSLSDYILPDYSHSLRRIIRKSYLLADSLTPGSGLPLLLAVVKNAANTLSSHFTQVTSNFTKAEKILKDEIELFKDIRKESCIEWKKLVDQDRRLECLSDCQSLGLIEAYKYLKMNTAPEPKMLDPNEAVICYDRFGLNEALLEQLASIKGYYVDREKFDKSIKKLKEYNKSLTNTPRNMDSHFDLSLIHFTDDSAKFSYSRDPLTGHYSIDNLASMVEHVWLDDRIVSKGSQIHHGSCISLVLSKTNFHSPLRGTEENPLGHIVLTNSSHQTAKMKILETQQIHNRIIHKGLISSLCKGETKTFVFDCWKADCFVSVKSVEDIMRNTTAAVLFKSILESKYESVLSYLDISPECFFAKFYLYGQQFKIEDALQCEKKINNEILRSTDFNCLTISPESLIIDNSISLFPYINQNLSSYQVLSSNNLDFKVSGVTASPNVLNSEDLSKFCLSRFHLGKRSRECTLSGITGAYRVDRLFQDTSTLINDLLSSDDKDEINNLLKDAKKTLFNNQVPLQLQDTLKNTMEKVKSWPKRKMVKR